MKEKRANTVWSPLAAIVLIVFSTCFPVSAAPARIFPIGVWLEASPGSGEKFERYALTKTVNGKVVETDEYARAFFTKCFAKIRAMKFNTVRSSNLPHNRPDIVNAFMSLADQHKLWVVLDPGEGHNLMKYTYAELKAKRTMWKDYLKTRVVDKFSKYANLLGYAVIDEPSIYQCYDINGNKVYPAQAEKLARLNFIVQLLAELDPDHPDYTAFCDPTWLKAAIDGYSSTFKTIVYDNYPFEQGIPLYQMGPLPTNPTKGHLNWYSKYQSFYFAGTPIVYNARQISVVQTFKGASCPWRYPNPDELKTCVYTSLAAGAKGIFYFLFMDMFPATVDPSYGLVNANCVPTTQSKALYDAVCSMNAELEIIGPRVINLSPVTAGANLGWETTSKILGGEYGSELGVPSLLCAPVYIIAHKNPNPSVAPVNYSIQLPLSKTYNNYLTNVVTNSQYKPNASGVAIVSAPPAKGMVLRLDSTPK